MKPEVASLAFSEIMKTLTSNADDTTPEDNSKNSVRT